MIVNHNLITSGNVTPKGVEKHQNEVPLCHLQCLALR